MNTAIHTRGVRALLLLAALGWACMAGAQPAPPGVAAVEPAPNGAGPLLVLLTGADGAPNHRLQAQAFAREGWTVHVVDSNGLTAGSSGEDLRALLKRSLAQPMVRSKRAALVGYSLGGWLVLAYGNRMPELVSAAVAYYPSTFRAGEPKAFLAEPPVAVPTLMLAGVKDTYMQCCTIDRARALMMAAALPDVRAPLTLIEYPEADHGFVMQAFPQVYRPADDADAMRRAVQHLRSFASKE